MPMSLLAGVLALLAASQSAFDPGAYQRAVDNYRALANGQVTLSQLSPQERADVAELDRRLRDEGTDLRNARERCIDDQVAHHGGAPSALDWEVIELACSGR